MTTRRRRRRRRDASLIAPARSPWRRLAPFVLVAATMLVYANSLQGVWLLDDHGAIVDNPHVRQLWPPTAPPDSTLDRRPVAALSFAISYALGGLDPRGYHALNVAVHVLAALTVLALLRRTFRAPRLAGRLGEHADALAFAAAAAWAVHPLLTQAVTYVVQRTESLASLFVLLTIYAVARAQSSTRPGRWHAAAVAACALAMGTKEIAVATPLLAWVYVRVFFHRARTSDERVASDPAGRRLWIGLGLTWVVPALLLLGDTPRQSMGFGSDAADPWTYAMSQGAILVHYLRLVVWPAGLTFDYAWPPATDAVAAAPGLVAGVALVVATGWSLARRPSLGFGGAWFLLLLAPTSSVVPILDLAVEHRTYLASAAPITLAMVALYLGARRIVASPAAAARAFTVVAAVIAILLGAATVRRNATYRSAVAMWSDVVANAPRNARGWNELGLAFLDARRPADAEPALRTAVGLRPDDAKAQWNLGRLYAESGRPDDARLAFEAAISSVPGYLDAHTSLATLLLGQGDLTGGAEHLEAALRLDPERLDVRYNLAGVLLALGRHGRARQEFEAVLDREPDHVLAMVGKAGALAAMGSLDGAREALERARVLAEAGPDPSLRELVRARLRALPSPGTPPGS